MRQSHTQRTAGFTLIELLAVIAILMILVGLIMTVVKDAMRDAKLNRARSEMSEIHNAVQAYFHEYGTLPLPDPSHHGNPRAHTNNDKEDFYTTTNNLARIYEILRGDNPKQIKFLRKDLSDPHGLYRDPWKSPYFLAMDQGYNGSINTQTPNGARSLSLEGIICVYCIGPDRKWDRLIGVGRNSDDMLSSADQTTQGTI